LQANFFNNYKECDQDLQVAWVKSSVRVGRISVASYAAWKMVHDAIAYDPTLASHSDKI